MKHSLLFPFAFAAFVLCSGIATALAQPTPVTVENIDASGDDYTYFSLRENKVVAVADEKADAWDLAFKGAEIKVNGMAQYVDEAFEDLDEAPADGYVPGDALPRGSGNGWFLYQADVHVVIPVPDRVLVVKTKDGKYAKVQILSYYKDSPDGTPSGPARFYTIRYVFQPDGSRVFE